MLNLLRNLQLSQASTSSPFASLVSPSSLTPGTPCEYSKKPSLPFSMDAQGLASWLSTPHPDHNMASLDYYGHLIDDEGEIIGFSAMIQQQFEIPGSAPYLAEFSICNDNTNGVVVAPFLIKKDAVQFTSNPFSETANVKLGIDEKITIALVSGEMGQPGAKYKLTGNAFAFDLVYWTYDIELTDTMGTVGVGYGPLSFLPQWLTTAQENAITNNYTGNVKAYLENAEDSMEGQGSYYYSLPMLQVTSFSITKDDTVYASGSGGYLWVDYVTQSFSETSFPVLKDKAKWQFLAIQFPPELNTNNFSGALMFSKVEMPIPGDLDATSLLPTARLYYNGSDAKRKDNTALESWNDWVIQDIKFESSDLWPKDGKPQFPLQFTLTLGDPKDKTNYAVLQGKAVRQDQEVKLVHKYEGMYKITGSIYVKDVQLDTVSGYAWGEIH